MTTLNEYLLMQCNYKKIIETLLIIVLIVLVILYMLRLSSRENIGLPYDATSNVVEKVVRDDYVFITDSN